MFYIIVIFYSYGFNKYDKEHVVCDKINFTLIVLKELKLLLQNIMKNMMEQHIQKFLKKST